ncbi:hypothetical protein HDU98_000474 [Podochytrium sp. JEL0797]|nr:hypothetical protein HDU98_000474 [Podochytrium sp. JEL0797]
MHRTSSVNSTTPSVTARARKPVNYKELPTPVPEAIVTEPVAQVDSRPEPVPKIATPVHNTAIEIVRSVPTRRVALPIPARVVPTVHSVPEDVAMPVLPQPQKAVVNFVHASKPQTPITVTTTAGSGKLGTESTGRNLNQERVARPVGARKMTTDADQSWKELYEDLYEKSCAFEHDQTMRMQALKATVGDLEGQVLELQKQIMEMKKKEREHENKKTGPGKENMADSGILVDGGHGELDVCALEVQDLAQKIKKSLNIHTLSVPVQPNSVLATGNMTASPPLSSPVKVKPQANLPAATAATPEVNPPVATAAVAAAIPEPSKPLQQHRAPVSLKKPNQSAAAAAENATTSSTELKTPVQPQVVKTSKPEHRALSENSRSQINASTPASPKKQLESPKDAVGTGSLGIEIDHFKNVGTPAVTKTKSNPFTMENSEDSNAYKIKIEAGGKKASGDFGSDLLGMMDYLGGW